MTQFDHPWFDGYAMDVCMLILVWLSNIVALKDGIVLSVSRRLTGDTYTLRLIHNNSYVHNICLDNNPTFLVSERRCVENEELFNGNIITDPCDKYNYRNAFSYNYIFQIAVLLLLPVMNVQLPD